MAARRGSNAKKLRRWSGEIRAQPFKYLDVGTQAVLLAFIKSGEPRKILVGDFNEPGLGSSHAINYKI